MADSVVLLIQQTDGQVAMNLEIDGHSVFYFPHAILPTFETRCYFCADSKDTDIQHKILDILRVLSFGYLQMF